MATEKITVTLDAATLAAGREVAARSGRSFSAWLNDAAEAKLRRDGARAAAAYLASPDGVELAGALRHSAARRAGMLPEADAA